MQQSFVLAAFNSTSDAHLDALPQLPSAREHPGYVTRQRLQVTSWPDSVARNSFYLSIYTLITLSGAILGMIKKAFQARREQIILSGFPLRTGLLQSINSLWVSVVAEG
jgi:hypothetical protein